MATAGDLVKRSLRLISVLTRGETMSAEDGAEGLEALNTLVHSWYADDLLVSSLTRESVTLTQGKSSYTIGDGADLDTTRPMAIETIVLRESGGTDYYLDEMTQRYFARLSVKDYSIRPNQFYYEEGWPSGTIYFDSAPDKAYTTYITSYKPFSDLSSLASTVSLPPMYQKGLAFALAEDLAPEYGMEVPQTVARQAQASRLAIKHRNMGNRPVQSRVDTGLMRGGGRKFDIRSDQ